MGRSGGEGPVLTFNLVGLVTGNQRKSRLLRSILYNGSRCIHDGVDSSSCGGDFRQKPRQSLAVEPFITKELIFFLSSA